MIKLLLRQADQPEVEVKVEGNIARVGRAPGSQILLTQNYVSKRHLRVLKGVVIVDLGSANGTFLNGMRIKEPVLYTGGELRIGDGDVFLTISLDDVQDGPATADSVESARGLEPLTEARPQLLESRAENKRLELLLEESRKRIGEFESEIAALAESRAPSDAQREAEAALERANLELQELRSQLSALKSQEGKPATPPSPAAELFLKLQSENSTLKRKLAEFQAKPGASPAGSAQQGEIVPAKLLAEIVELRAQNAAFRAQGRSGNSRTTTPPASLPSANASSNVRGLFARLAKDDVDRQPPLLGGSPEEFLVIEQFRLLRHVERIITRMAGDLIELLACETMLPSLQGNSRILNMRSLITRMGDPADDATARSELLEYFAQLSRWLVVSLGANRKAAAAFAQKLKTDLSEEALTANAPIPAFKRISGQAEAELWRRTGIYLRDLTPDMVTDRLEKLSREAAVELLNEDDARRAAKPK